MSDYAIRRAEVLHKIAMKHHHIRRIEAEIETLRHDLEALLDEEQLAKQEEVA